MSADPAKRFASAVELTSTATAIYDRAGRILNPLYVVAVLGVGASSFIAPGGSKIPVAIALLSLASAGALLAWSTLLCRRARRMYRQAIDLLRAEDEDAR